MPSSTILTAAFLTAAVANFLFFTGLAGFVLLVMIAGGVREELQRAFLLHRFEQRLGGGSIGLALTSIVSHVAADLPTDTGIPLLLPFSRRRLSLNLWENTGHWGDRCTPDTTGSHGPGYSRAPCSPWSPGGMPGKG